ncbi:HNH endonuclease [Parolsenella catena]|uniref:HNH endonuclease n=1 Tax=Parolsenella catena TaxID=2003188 RepID=UPI003A5BFFF0
MEEELRGKGRGLARAPCEKKAQAARGDHRRRARVLLHHRERPDEVPPEELPEGPLQGQRPGQKVECRPGLAPGEARRALRYRVRDHAEEVLREEPAPPHDPGAPPADRGTRQLHLPDLRQVYAGRRGPAHRPHRPRVQGGKTVPSNLQVLCSKCNGSKSNR